MNDQTFPDFMEHYKEEIDAAIVAREATATVLPFPPKQLLYIDDVAMSKHINNLIGTYGEARVFQFLSAAYGLKAS